jgi:serine/threonine protein kinase
MSSTNAVSDAASTQVLAFILHDIGAFQYFQGFIDDFRDDDSLLTLSKLKPEQIARKYGMPDDLELAAAFVDKCRLSLVAQPSGDSHSASTLISSSSAPPALPASPVDDPTIMRSLNFEIIRELGRGGFGTVYEAKNLSDKLIVALKIVKDPANAIQAIREGQRLRRVKHKNIVVMHKVHDFGNGTCALEMEVVSGGDLSHHLEARRRNSNFVLPHQVVLRFSRQLLEALAYLHDEMKWLHGDIKPQNILLQCNPVPSDGSPVNYSSAEIKLADFGLTKILDQHGSTQSLMLSSFVGVLKGTMFYLSPEAFQGASSGGYERTVSDDLWSSCLVIFEMDSGLSIQQIIAGHGGSVKIDELLTKTSPELLPLLYSILVERTRSSAAELLRMLDAAVDPFFVWQVFEDLSRKYVPVHPASSVLLEKAFSMNQPHSMLMLQPPLDLQFDIQALLSVPTALGLQTERRSGINSRIRRVLKASALASGQSISLWQELVDGKEWLQCSPTLCAKLDIDIKNPNVVVDLARYRRITLQSNSLDQTQLPHPLKSEPYLAPAHADDVIMLNNRVHESLPEWDVTGMVQIVNTSLASKYAAYRLRVAARCNGNPNERMMFHFAHPSVMTKIWQEGEGHDPRLSNWAEVGKGAYFSKHVMYGYAYKYFLWPSPPGYVVQPEPPIGESMQVFVTLVCLGNVADMGPGCETCPSPAWDAWKNEPPILPKPTRPPAMMLPIDVAEKQHVLDLTQVKDAPRYDSVKSTEGDMGTNSASTNKDSSGRRICDIMHPRLKHSAKTWAEQYVVFDSAASYPMFIATLTKMRDSPMGPQQLIDAGCDFNRFKSLGFSASSCKAVGFSAQELRVAGFNLDELRAAGFDVSALGQAHFDARALRKAGYTALQLQHAGFSPFQMRGGGFRVGELLDIGCDVHSLLAAGCSVTELRSAGLTVTGNQLKEAGCKIRQLYCWGFSADELQGLYSETCVHQFIKKSIKGCNDDSIRELKKAGFTALQLEKAGANEEQLDRGGFFRMKIVFGNTMTFFEW